MGYPTKIPYCDATWSPWIGCSKRCAWCWAEQWARSTGQFKRTGFPFHQPARAKNWTEPRKWARTPFVCPCGMHGSVDQPCLKCDAPTHRLRIFPDLCDWLDEAAPVEWLVDFLGVIHITPALRWMLLTQKPENFKARMFAAAEWAKNHGSYELAGYIQDWAFGHYHGFTNVMVGATVTNAGDDPRLLDLFKIAAIAHWLSIEPMIGPVHLRAFDARRLHFVVFGGMSGGRHKKYPLDPRWITSQLPILDAAGTRVFVKQDSGPLPGRQGHLPPDLWAWKEQPDW